MQFGDVVGVAKCAGVIAVNAEERKMNVVEKSLESRTPDNPSSSITILINTATSSTLDNNGDEKEKIQHLHSNLTTASSVFRCFEVQMTNSLF